MPLISEHEVKCGDCGTLLLRIVVTESNENRDLVGEKKLYSVYKVLGCWKCGGSSWTTKVIEGSAYVHPTAYDIDTVKTEVQGDIVYNTLKIVGAK